MRRLLNYYLVRYQEARGHTRLRGYPIRLAVEPANVCNLRCPGCLTGVGEVGRERSFMPLELYHRLLDELGDCLFQIEFHNWGEPLLSKDVHAMIQEASERGIGTIASTNFSLPFDAARAERLVSSGLAILGVSLDGARQETYEQYRVRGDLETVLKNCRLMQEAKKRLRSATPRMVWEFHVFEHNVDDIELARATAKELEMDLVVSKAWVVGPEWEPGNEYSPRDLQPAQAHCPSLWERAVVCNDGGVAPCCGAFYGEDDLGKLKTSAEDTGESTFREVWNSPTFQEARRLFRSRTGSEATRKLICFDCPATVTWERYRDHLAAGGDRRSFRSGVSANDCSNFFFNRRVTRPGAAAVADTTETQPVEDSPRQSS